MLRSFRFRSLLLASALAGISHPAFAQDAAAASSTAAPESASAPMPAGQVDPRIMLELMVQKGLVSRADADEIIRRSTVAPPVAIAAAPTAPTTPGQPPAQPGVQTIPYIPAPVRAQIKEELRQEVVQQAKAEGWATPNSVPDWVSGIRISGDMRVRAEGVLMGDHNFDQFPNFTEINQGSGYDVSPSNPANPPFLNTTKDRFLPRVRARLDIAANVTDWIGVEFRAATGNDSSPVSPNQTLGGGNGDFSKYAIWLDRADLWLKPAKGLRLDLGRFDNPFWTTDLFFYSDLGFDGAAFSYKRHLTGGGEGQPGLDGFVSAGVFPIQNTALNFGSNDVGSFSSRDKYLGAVQAGLTWQPNADLRLKAALGYFHFGYIQGKVSSPCLFSQDACDSDDSRFLFQQFGNSVVPVRNIIPDPTVAPGLSPEVQYFGLASKFRVLEAHGQIDILNFSPTLVRLEGEYVHNLAFDRSDVALEGPVNNFGDGGNFEGGGFGWNANLLVGHPELDLRGDWQVTAGYKYLKSDAVPDAFTDPDFHFGGTNARGFILGAGYAFARHTSFGLRWLSAKEISGPLYSNDVIQLDLNTRF